MRNTDDAILGWGTTRFASIKVQHAPRTIGESNYTPWRLFNQLLLLITGYSTGPLRLGSIIGFVFTFLGFALLVYVLVLRLMVGSPLGFAFQMSVLTIFGGAQLFILGIMGEYLARMFNRVMDRPTYTIRETLGYEPGRDP